MWSVLLRPKRDLAGDNPDFEDYIQAEDVGRDHGDCWSFYPEVYTRFIKAKIILVYLCIDWWNGYIYDFSSILELNLGPDETFIWDLDFPDLLKSRCRHKVIKIWIWKVEIPYSMPIWAKTKT